VEFNDPHNMTGTHLMTMSNKELLLNAGLFDKLNEHQIAKLLEKTEEVKYPKGKVFIHEGDTADAIYIVKEGSAHAFTFDENKEKVVLAEYQSGYFGERALLSKTVGKRHSSVEASTDLILLKIPEIYFRKTLEIDTKLHEKLKEISHEKLLEKLQAQAKQFHITKDSFGDITNGTKRNFHAGDRIFSEGDVADGVYFVLQGTVELYKKDDKQEDQLITLLGKNEMFGELGVLKNQPRVATAIAIDDLKTLFIDNDRFHQLYQKNKQLHELIKSLHRFYETPRRGQVIQFLGKFLDKDAIITCVQSKDGRSILSSRVIGEHIHAVKHDMITHNKTFHYERGDDITSDLFMLDQTLIGFTCFGEWGDLPQAYKMIFEQIPIDESQLAHFQKTGELPVTEPTEPIGAAADDEVTICYCMSVNHGDIKKCIESGDSDVDAISAKTGAGTMCTHCIIRIQELIDALASKQ